MPSAKFLSEGDGGGGTAIQIQVGQPYIKVYRETYFLRRGGGEASPINPLTPSPLQNRPSEYMTLYGKYLVIT